MISEENKRKVYTLREQPLGSGKGRVSILVSNTVTTEYIQAEWGYCIRFGADGLDLPNYAKSLEMLKERQPEWEFVEYVTVIAYDPKNVSPK